MGGRSPEGPAARERAASRALSASGPARPQDLSSRGGGEIVSSEIAGEERQPLTADQRSSFVAALLGWTMDAFDYFLVVLVYAEIAADFGTTLTRMAFLTTVTLAMRPVGALLFGLAADRMGRRIPLMVDVCFYSLVGFLCAFAPSYGVLLVLRLLYGI